VESDIEGLTETPETRLNYETIAGNRIEIGGFDNESPKERYRLQENREVLVVVKRGVGASYVQDRSDLHKDLKALQNRMTWKDILANGRYLDPENDPVLKL
jgi:hypothetical protein